MTEGAGGLHYVTELDASGEQPRCLHDEWQRVDRLSHCDIPTDEDNRASHVAAVVVDRCVKPIHQLHALGPFAAIEADRLPGIAQPHQRISECRVELLVAEAEPNEW